MSDWLDRSLQDLAAEDPPAEALAEVRMRVIERVQTKRRNWVWWLVPAAAAAGLAVWLALPGPSTAPVSAPIEIASKAPAAPAALPVAPLPRQPANAAQPARRQRPTRPAPVEISKTFQPRILPTGSPDFVQIESGDPNVVILWSMNSPTITDQSGENK